MKSFKLTWGALAISACLIFSGCQKDDAVTPDTDVLDAAFSSADFQLEDLNALEKVSITGATETTAFGMGHTDASTETRHPLAHILERMNLDERQKLAVRGFVQEHNSCIKEHHAKIQELHKQLLSKANAIREEYIRAYNAGRISKAELEQKLHTLRERMQEELNKDEVKQMHMRILRKCRQDLFSKIASVLNSEQLRMWNHWKENLPR